MRLAVLLATVSLAAGPLTGLAGEPSSNAIGPGEAVRRAGKRVTMRMLVKATGGIVDHNLHSAPPGKVNRPPDFVVVIPQTAVPAFEKVNIDNPREFYKGKTIEVFGQVVLGPKGMMGRITVTDPKNIQVVTGREVSSVQGEAKPKAIDSYAAAKELGKQVTMRMTVRSFTKVDDQRLRPFVDGTTGEEVTTATVVCIPKSARSAFKLAQIDNPGEFYNGKTIEVTGPVSLGPGGNRAMIVISDPKDIKVVAD